MVSFNVRSRAYNLAKVKASIAASRDLLMHLLAALLAPRTGYIAPMGIILDNKKIAFCNLRITKTPILCKPVD